MTGYSLATTVLTRKQIAASIYASMSPYDLMLTAAHQHADNQPYDPALVRAIDERVTVDHLIAMANRFRFSTKHDHLIVCQFITRMLRGMNRS